MKMNTLELLRNLQHRFSRSRRWLFVAAITLCLIPSNTRAQGIGDILLLLHTITSTLQGPIGDALNEMRKVSTEINNFRQKIIWPLALINQTRSFVNATRAQYAGLMSQIEGLKNNSATLALPMQLESMFRGAQSGSIGQIPSLYTQVYQPVALAGIAQPGQRNLMDIDDAMAMDSLKTSMVSDQTTQGMLTLADSLEQQAATAAPGSASMVTAQARVADLVTQAQLAKMLAAQLRQEATKLAHQNATLKHSATTTQTLFNQIQKVLAHP
jgi:methyl-accepting chemotaxis protein